MIINVGADTGYGYALSVSATKELCIPNYIKQVTESDVEEIVGNVTKLDENNIILKYQNNYYVVGRLAIKMYPYLTRRLSIVERIRDTYHLVELLSLLGLQLNQNNFDVNLVVGLPNRMGLNDKREMEKWLKSTFKFVYLTADGVVERNIRVENVVCISQPTALIFNLDPEDRNQVILAIDIGHNTTDAIIWQYDTVVQDKNLKLCIQGVKMCYNRLADLLISKFGKEYKLTEVMEKDLQYAIETGLFTLHGKKHDISDLLTIVFEEFVDYIFTEISNVYGAYLPIVDSIICGGGIMVNDRFAEMLSKKFKSVYNVSFFRPSKPQYAIANGFWRLANELYTDDFTAEVIEHD